MATRKAIMQALFDRLKTCYAFRTFGRRLKDPEGVAADNRPALYVIKNDDDFNRSAENLPPERLINAWAIVYTDAGQDRNAIPEDEENDILDAIDAALAPSLSDDGFQTLGGLVHNCLIDGKIERASGDVTGKGLFAVPIKIILP